MQSWIVILTALSVLVGLALVLAALMRLKGAFRQAEDAGRAREGADAVLEAKLRDLAAAQHEIAGRFAQLGSHIETLDKRMGESLKDTATRTAETLGSLQARLKVIDEAQKTLSDLSAGLSGHVVNLQQILSNKQARGAYGQGQMESIIRDALPPAMYDFQATLSNRTRPDCLIHLPDTKTAIVIDSKFPLEGFELLRAAANDLEKRAAAARIKNDVLKHVKDIADKYLIAGETQEPAIMFVPSESIYAELCDSFSDVMQQAHRVRVVVVSPNILMLAVNTVQTLLKDARMREQANLIQREVGELLKDTNRLAERVENLQRHMRQADGDLKDILTSADKIAGRAERIEQVELPIPDGAPQLPGRRDDASPISRAGGAP